MSFLKSNNETAIYKDIKLDHTSKNISIRSPYISNPNLILTFEVYGSKVTVDGVVHESGVTINDFSSPVKYKVIDAYGKVDEYTISVTYSGLPVLFVHTPSNRTIPDKHSDWLAGTEITLYNTDWTVNHSSTTGIRGRGNSTWSYPKKPYALKLDSKASILGMPKHKRWVLLANWMDRTIMRNRVAFEVASRTSLAWTPRGEFVELILNGEHKGNYYLCEHIKVDKNRVNVDEFEDDETDSGYIMELDTYYDEAYKFKSAYYKLPYMFKDPDEVNTAQFNFIQNYVNTLEASLNSNTRFADREYTDYIDVDSFIDWWIVHELTGNEEPKHPKSSYMHKDSGGKLTMGPVWDFDWGTFMPHTKFVVLNRTDGLKPLYYDRLFQDAQFKARVKERWNALKADLSTIPDFIDSEAARIKGSESMNHNMWPCNTKEVIGYIVNQDEDMTFEQAINRMKSAYSGKFNWMDSQINRW
jgi:spore coat protein CotH